MREGPEDADSPPPAKRQKSAQQNDGTGTDDENQYGDWQPKANANWENMIKTIETVERDEKSSDLYILLRWKNGKASRIKNRLVRDKAPQRLLDFFEAHLSV